MQHFILRTDRFEAVDELVPNRGMFYADGCFDTFWWKDGKAVFWNAHRERIAQTLAYLHMDAGSLEHLETAISRRFEQQRNHHLTYRCRLTFYRDGGGKYLPELNTVRCVLSTESLDFGVFNNQKTGSWRWSEEIWFPRYDDRFKLLTKHNAVRFALEAKRAGVEDLFILNDQGALVSAVSGNVAVYVNGKWLTPPLSDGCLAGTIRAVFIQSGFLEEESIPRIAVEHAKAIVTMNSIQGVKVVQGSDEDTVNQLKKDLLSLF